MDDRRDGDVNVLALVKGVERYVFLYDDSRRVDALRTLGRFAANPDLAFTWYDAAVLSQKIRGQPQQPTNRLVYQAGVAAWREGET